MQSGFFPSHREGERERERERCRFYLQVALFEREQSEVDAKREGAEKRRVAAIPASLGARKFGVTV